MHRARLLALAVAAAVAVSACASSGSATWTYAPASPATPAPSAAPSGSAGVTPSIPASVAPSGGAASPSEGGGSTIELTAQGIAYDKASLQVPAGQPFSIKFHNADAGVPHNVAIKDSSGAEVFKGEIFSGDDTKTYQVPALPAGSYTFVCSVHPNMTGTLAAGG